MKRIFLVFFSTLALLSVNVATVSAQFTLLPQAPEASDCQAILAEYELTRKVPSRKDIAQDVATKASSAYISLASPKMLLTCGPQSIDPNSKECQEYNANIDKAKAESDAASEAAKNADAKADDFGALLGCSIKTGRVSLQMIPHFISFFANFLLGMSGLISVLFIVIGGFMYIYGGITDQKERGKKYIGNALMGMVLALMAWTIVSVIIFALTS